MKLNRTADLHIHTIASDGTYTPRQVLEEARRVGLTAISVTDHDSVESLADVISLETGYGIEVIPGIEISVEIDETEMHLLGYFIDYQDRVLLDRLSELRKIRTERAGEMLRKLKEMGFPLDMETLLPGQMTGAIGRLHIAHGLLRSGYIGNIHEAFKRYIGNDGPAYVPKLKLEREDAMEMIIRAGGVPVLAHPGQLDRDDLIPELIDLGLAGLEAFYPSHSRFKTNHYVELARHYNILATGGSDCHGDNKENVIMGEVRVPYQVVLDLHKKKNVQRKSKRNLSRTITDRTINGKSNLDRTITPK